jgi:hypothetical protein
VPKKAFESPKLTDRRLGYEMDILKVLINMHRFLTLKQFTSIIALLFIPSLPSNASGLLHIEKCSSGIEYPDKGDESVDVVYNSKIYHLRIFHPRSPKSAHFSSPFFWVSEQNIENSEQDYLSIRSHIGVLGWHSIRGYFFAEKKRAIRGYFIQDGFDNADWGSSGLLFLHDGKSSRVWRWVYERSPGKKKGKYDIFSMGQKHKKAPVDVVDRIKDVLALAENEANAWPGP